MMLLKITFSSYLNQYLKSQETVFCSTEMSEHLSTTYNDIAPCFLRAYLKLIKSHFAIVMIANGAARFALSIKMPRENRGIECQYSKCFVDWI